MLPLKRLCSVSRPGIGIHFPKFIYFHAVRLFTNRFKMAEFLDVSDELPVLILAHIRKPSHILQLALVNKRVHGIAIQHLYANVTFDHDDYNTLTHPRLWDNLTPPHPHIQLLAKMIRSNALPSGQIVTSLNITVAEHSECNLLQTSLALLLPQLSSLKHLTLKSVSLWSHGQFSLWSHEQFSLAPLASALSETSQTLESLSLAICSGTSRDGWTIGSLRHFPKLKHLSIQELFLLSEYALDSPQGCKGPDLRDILPSGLKTLRLRWNWKDRVQNLNNYHDILKGFVSDSLRDRRPMKELVVDLDPGIKDRFDELKVGFLEENLALLNEKSRLGGLDLRMTLEWTQC
ncbi:hypothetical protein BDR22DRAFT_850563 [Usnea florida]